MIHKKILSVLQEWHVVLILYTWWRLSPSLIVPGSERFEGHMKNFCCSLIYTIYRIYISYLECNQITFIHCLLAIHFIPLSSYIYNNCILRTYHLFHKKLWYLFIFRQARWSPPSPPFLSPWRRSPTCSRPQGEKGSSPVERGRWWAGYYCWC